MVGHRGAGGRRGSVRRLADAGPERHAAVADRGAAPDDRGDRADHARRAARAHRQGAAADGRQPHRRHPRRRRHEHVLFHRRALGPERAPLCRRHPGEGRVRVGLPRLRGGAGARADQVRHRHPHVAGRRQPLPRDRADLQGSRDRDRPHRRRGTAALLHHERRQDRSAGARVRQRRPGHRRLPHDQVAGRDRADAARQRHDDRRLQGRARHAARRHDPGRPARTTSSRPIDAIGAAQPRRRRSASASTPPSRTAASRRRN